MTQWFTARELAEMDLPEMPKTQQGFDKLIKKEQWPSRLRKGRGGGREYAATSLPDAAYEAVLERCVFAGLDSGLRRNDRGNPEPRPRQMDAKKQKDRAETKKTARFFIAEVFEQMMREERLSRKIAEPIFTRRYAQHSAEGRREWFPDWVFEAVPEISVSSLRRWRAERKNNRGVFNPIQVREKKEILRQAEDGQVLVYLATLLVTNPQLNHGHLRDLVRAEFGAELKIRNPKTGEDIMVPLPKIRSFERFVKTWKKENTHVYEKMTNPDGYKNKYQLALGSQSQIADGLNAVWEIDASPTDALCVDGRYTIYAIIDVWSRRAMFWASRTPKTESSLMMIRRAIMAWGVPHVIKTDNGSDFKSHRFRGALRDLGIEQKLCPPYTPEGKPHVERVIKTIQHGLMPLLPGYVGHSVSDRSKIEARRSFAQKLGMDDAKAFAVSLTHEELQKYLDQWAEDKYAHNLHRGIGMSPFQKFSSWAGEIRRIENERALDLLLAPIAGSDGYRTVTKKALRIEGRQYYGAGLEMYVGKRVLVRHDPYDYSTVYIFDEDGAYLCDAHDYLAQSDEDQAGHAAKGRLGQKGEAGQGVRDIRRHGKAYATDARELTTKVLDQATEDRSKIVELSRPSVAHNSAALTSGEEAMEGTAANILTPVQRPLKLIEAHQPKKTTREQDEDEWWDRRMGLLADQELGKTMSERDVNWLAWYEARPEFIVREHFRLLREADHQSGEGLDSFEAI